MAMDFTLIICTYMRPQPLFKLLQSVKHQTLYPNHILIIDSSVNDETSQLLEQNPFKNLKYYKVDDAHTGLTKQRNFGIQLVDKATEVICFLDDDTVLNIDYFEQLLSTYQHHPEALGVGGYIINEVNWEKAKHTNNKNYFYYDGWQRIEPSRFKIRQKFGLHPDAAPGYLPTFSHGRSIGFLPPSGKIYPVELLMGGVSSYKKEVFKSLKFSTYFEGYGLYEDADFSLRVAKAGKLYINTLAQLSHYHEASGRPNQYKYGKMVVENGWHVWRVKYPNPSLISFFKWHATSFLLTLIRFTNCFNTNKKQEALTESLGRIIGWFSIFIKKRKQ